MTIRAMRLKKPGGLDRLYLDQVADPGEPGPGEIRVKVAASSLNFHDYLVCAGKSPVADGLIPLSDAGGTVEAVGAGVSGFRVGDAVISTFFRDWQGGALPTDGFAQVPGDGLDGYARQVVVAPATGFTRAPKGWSTEEAATLTCAGLTAWHALFVDTVTRPGSTVLVLGTGGVSIFALQFAKMAGARVIATSSSGEKLERLADMGADALINYREVPEWGSRVMELTDGVGVDTVIEVGGPGTLNQSMKAARVGGHVALIGVLTGVAGPVATGIALTRSLTVKGLVVGSHDEQRDMIAAIDASTMRPVIDRRFALEELADAFRHQESGSHFGKISITVD